MAFVGPGCRGLHRLYRGHSGTSPWFPGRLIHSQQKGLPAKFLLDRDKVVDAHRVAAASLGLPLRDEPAGRMCPPKRCCPALQTTKQRPLLR